jgi:hypothetical protein
VAAGKQAQLVVLASFLVTLSLVRPIAHAIRDGRLRHVSHNVQTGGGLHIRHQVIGILLLLVAGMHQHRRRPGPAHQAAGGAVRGRRGADARRARAMAAAA